MEKSELIFKMLEMAMGENQAATVKATGAEEYLGKHVFIRTVTHHYTGCVVSVGSLFMKLNTASWIADDGRLNEFVRDTSKANEVEPYKNPISVGLYSICEITEVDDLPIEVK